MLCCVGLFGGMAVGQYLGGPWTVIAPAAGFGIGFIGDMKFMHKMHGRGGEKAPPRELETGAPPGIETHEGKVDPSLEPAPSTAKERVASQAP